MGLENDCEYMDKCVFKAPGLVCPAWTRGSQYCIIYQLKKDVEELKAKVEKIEKK